MVRIRKSVVEEKGFACCVQNEIAAVRWDMHRVVRRQTDIRGHGSVGTVSTGVLTGSAFQLLGVVVGRGGGSVVTGTSSPEDCVAPMAGVL